MSQLVPAGRRDQPRHGVRDGTRAEEKHMAAVLLSTVAALLSAGTAVYAFAGAHLHGSARTGLTGVAAMLAVLSAGAGIAAWRGDLRTRAQLRTMRADWPAPPGQASQESLADIRVEVFVSMGRRMQSLLHRQIGVLDETENQTEDPGLLKRLFEVDHYATRMRRYTESLAVLGGAVTRRQWTRPVPVQDVLRAAVAEVDQYARVKIVPPVPGMLQPGAVADVIHLVAEFIDNATKFSAPATQPVLRAGPVAAGLAVEVEDRGLGMEPGERQRLNDILADPSGRKITDLLQDGRIGLYVVAMLARRHGILVQLQANIFGGTSAVAILPHTLANTDSPSPVPRQTSRPAPPAENSSPPLTADFPEPEPRPVPAAASGRPSLPQRSTDGSYMAPQLRHLAEPRDQDDDTLTPGLMASFQDGFRRSASGDDL